MTEHRAIIVSIGYAYYSVPFDMAGTLMQIAADCYEVKRDYSGSAANPRWTIIPDADSFMTRAEFGTVLFSNLNSPTEPQPPAPTPEKDNEIPF
jgi:hypothetical protein